MQISISENTKTKKKQFI